MAPRQEVLARLLYSSDLKSLALACIPTANLNSRLRAVALPGPSFLTSAVMPAHRIRKCAAQNDTMNRAEVYNKRQYSKSSSDRSSSIEKVLEVSESSGSSADSNDVVMDFADEDSSSLDSNIHEHVSLTDEDSLVDEEDDVIVQPTTSRAYQLEMLDRSLKENVIVAMDTGSGKTQVAVLRISAALESSAAGKIIWFLAPTVLLAEQQHEVIKLQIPSVQSRLLTGKEKVDHWSPTVWRTILEGTVIIVSTPQVLYDALSHAYLNVTTLALIIFDEAHNCVGKNPGGKIMIDFYHPAKASGETDLPAILGLTASPSISSRAEDIERLETTLDAKCVTPTTHRAELLKSIQRPDVYHVEYSKENATNPAIDSLLRVYQSMDITQDPWILSLAAKISSGSDPTGRYRRQLETSFMKQDTFSLSNIRKLHARSVDTGRELGTWAVDRYLCRAIDEYKEKLDAAPGMFTDFTTEERRYLVSTLQKVNITTPPPAPLGDGDISDKVRVLVKELIAADESALGIIFVKERTTVSILQELLLTFPKIKEKFRIGTVVGSSSHQRNKKMVYESSNVDLLVLQKFRAREINLLIATSVLEEGIDVPACNLVICFDLPATFKSFIQRRGRARMLDSKLVLFLEKSARSAEQWEKMEEEMKNYYQDETRVNDRLELLENTEESSPFCFIVESTGARLDFDNAKSHLEHFCAKTSMKEFVNARPEYIMTSTCDNRGERLGTTVLLPSFVPKNLRTAQSEYSWASEKNATKDAAFQAFLALYKAGLVNDHLMPLPSRDKVLAIESRESTASIVPLFNPWKPISQAWQLEGDRFIYTLTCLDQNKVVLGEYDLMLPVELALLQPICIHVDRDTEWEIRYSPVRRVSYQEASQIPDHMSALLSRCFGHRWSVKDENHVIRLFVKDMDMNLNQDNAESSKSEERFEQAKAQKFLIRDSRGVPFHYHGMLPCKPPLEYLRVKFSDYEGAPNDVPYLTLLKWSKRIDFLRKHNSGATPPQINAKPYTSILPLPWASVDPVPIQHVQFARLLPSLLHELGVVLIVQQFSSTLLKSMEFKSMDLVRMAISSRNACEPVDYERLEILGDSILKYCTCIMASSKHLEWPEGYLSYYKDRLVSNGRLTKASTEKGLPEFILTSGFSGHKWRPIYANDHLQEDENIPQKERNVSTKVLADVVEALVGASYLDGGINKATQCLRHFLDSEHWPEVSACRDILFDYQPSHDGHLAQVELLQELIGYKFQKKSFLTDAMTHASYVAAERSSERLEFLGDAVLDKIIVTKLFAVEPPLLSFAIHRTKTAFVNGDFLAFFCLEYGLERMEPMVTKNLKVTNEQVFTPLWKFLRHCSMEIGAELVNTAQRHQRVRGEILSAFESGTNHPWALLSRLKAKKFLSDLMEAIIGAIWVDSGSLEECEAFLERLGIMKYFDRVIRDAVIIEHPKERIGMLAVNDPVKYEVTSVEGENGKSRYHCVLSVGDRVVCRVEDGVDKEEVKVKAATEAVGIMEAELVIKKEDFKG